VDGKDRKGPEHTAEGAELRRGPVGPEKLQAENDLLKDRVLRLEHDLAERRKELSCIYGIADSLERSGTALEEVLQGVVDLLPRAWQYPEIACSRILLQDNREFRTFNFRETPFRQTSHILVKGSPVGAVEVFYLEERRGCDEGPFLKEERSLINAVAERLGRIIERHGVEKALRTSEEKYRSIFENASEGIFQTTPEGRYLSVNPAYAEMFGFSSPEEMIRAVSDIGQQRYVNPEDREGLTRLLAERGDIEGFETCFYRKDRSTFWASTNVHVVCDPDGGVLYYEGTSEDITGRKQAEETLLRSEERFRTILESSRDAILMMDSEGAVSYWNPAASRIFGYTRDEVVGRSLHELLTPERYRETHRTAYAEFLSGGRGAVPGKTLELQAVRKDGTEITVALSLAVERVGDRWHAVGILRDITEQKKAQEALRQSESLLSSIIEFLPDATFAIDLEGKILTWNRAIEEMTGYSAETMVGRGDYEYAIPFYGERRPVLVDFLSLWSDDIAEKYSYIKKDGDTLYTETDVPFVRGKNRTVWVKASPLRNEKGDVIGAIESIRDITEPRRAEKALREREETLRAFFDATHESMLLVDREGRIILANEVAAQRLGKSVQQLVGTREEDRLPADTARYRREQQKKVIATGRPLFFEDTRSGLSIEHYYYPVFDEEGKVSGVAIFARDITERKRSLAALEESEERYRTVVERSKDGIAIMQEGVHIYVNRSFLDIFGFRSAEEVLGKPHSVTVHPDDLEQVIAISRKRQEGHSAPSAYEFKGIRKDGSTIFLDAAATRIMYKGAYGSLVFLRDNTERKLAEEALKQAEAKYRSIFENAIEGIFQTTPEGRYISANPALAKMYGYDSPEEMMNAVTDIGRQQYVDPGDRARMKSLYEEQGFVDDFETRIYRKDGNQVWISMDAREVRDAEGNLMYYEGTAEDITARKRADEELRAAHRRVLDIIEFLPDATFVLDYERKVVAWNRTMEEMSGVRKEEMIGKGDYAYAVPFYGERRPVLVDLVFERDKENLEAYEYVEVQGDVLVAEIYVPMTYQGKGAYLSSRASPLFDQEGNVIGAIESVRDITEQKRIAEALKESEERYRTAIESSSDAVVMIKGEKYIYVNRKFLEIFGFDSVDQVLGKPVGSVTHPDDRERVLEMNRRRQRNDKVPHQYEFKGIKTNGDAVFVEVSATRTVYKGEPITLVYLRDVTARKHLEAQLLQSQKMEAIGTLAGGVAHDFNNILTAIIGYGSLLQMSMGSDPRRQYVDLLLASSQKAAILTQSLLAFGRKQAIELKPWKINAMVREAEKLLKRLLTEDIEFRVIPADPDITVEADVTQIDQVLMNLATNARDAMPGGGNLTIEIRTVHLGNGFVEAHGFGRPGDYALISVTDTGTGMDQATVGKIFEPFFTTKEVGKGTGLGLSIVYGIIKQHNGYITVSSERQKGTRFDVYLPVVKTPAGQEKQSYEQARGGNETILVAEDNKDVRRLAIEVLTGKGYTVIEAVDGDDAIRQFMKHKDEIDLLLLDVVMPGRNGKEAYEEMRRIKSGVKVLFTSGYTGDVVLTKGVSGEAINYIQKPLNPNELLKKIREVLDRQP